jgi:mono/diheme cytochrome c family protein
MKRALWLMMVPALALAQALNIQDVLKQGEEVFSKSCAVGYCHGPKGTGGSAPRLAARGFDQAYINNTVTGGVPGTAMSGFAQTLSRPDLSAVVAYIAALNGISNPDIAGAGGRGGGPPKQPLPPETARGRDLFSEAVRGFGRCSTCHEVNGIGIAVATAMTQIPANVQALRALATPRVATASVGGESMPAVVVSKARRNIIFYDLTVPPPVLRTVEPASAQTTDGSSWRHASAIGSYNDADLESILTYLRAVIKP